MVCIVVKGKIIEEETISVLLNPDI